MAKESILKALSHACDTRECIISEGAISQVAEIFSRMFPQEKCAVIIADPRTWKAAGEKTFSILSQAGVKVSKFILEPSGITFHADYKYVDEVREAISASSSAVPVAVGSGVVNDLVKRASGELEKSYMVVATAASVDGYSSFGASLRSPDGAKKTYSCPAPRAIIADLDVIRTAPEWMAASGYADLLSKIPAGADWLLARELGAAEWHSRAWHTVQDSLHDAVGDPEGVKAHESVALERFVEGLMLGGFAMQDMQSSRPASGAEHMFSHILEMRNHTFRGDIVPHGIQVGVFTRFMCALYEKMLSFDYTKLDIDSCVDAWPEWEEEEALSRSLFENTPFPDVGVAASRAKYINRDEVRKRLNKFSENWPEFKSVLERQLISAAEAERRLRAVGAPVYPEEIGSTPEQTFKDIAVAQHMRDRYNLLDFLYMTRQLDSFAKEVLKIK
jgi:glycerol-1-phosphate dehydrogenase [NAD(P)+]